MSCLAYSFALGHLLFFSIINPSLMQASFINKIIFSICSFALHRVLLFNNEFKVKKRGPSLKTSKDEFAKREGENQMKKD